MAIKHLEKYRKIGRQIAYYRNKQGISQQGLADLIGISKSYLSKIEAPKSEKPCSLEVLFDIVDVLGIDIGLLFNFQEEDIDFGDGDGDK